jgi:hypothetical protein
LPEAEISGKYTSKNTILTAFYSPKMAETIKLFLENPLLIFSFSISL